MESNEDIKRQLCAILKRFAKDGQELREETDLVADLGLDSLKVMTLLVEVEDNFDISVPLNVLPEVRTIKDFAMQIEQLIEEGQ